MGVATEWAEFIADVGFVLLRNGAETYRTSETMEYMALSLGVKRFDHFVIPSTVMVSLTAPDGSHTTVIRKVSNRTINLDRVTRINDLSRRMVAEKCSFVDAKKELRRIRIERTGFAIKSSIAFSGLVGVGFGVMQGGNVAECFSAFIAASLVRLVAHLVSQVEQTKFLYEFLGAICAASIGLFSSYLFDGIRSDIVIVGGIMPLVPGVAITNSIRDIINGDNLSGLVRGLEAALTSMAIAMGVLLTLSIPT